MKESESVTDYIIKAENIIMALKDTGEVMSDGLIVAMVLNGLPDSFKPLAVHVTQKIMLHLLTLKEDYEFMKRVRK